MSMETITTETRLADLRTGWRIWCRLGDESDCLTPDQRYGYALAAEANEGGGNRPTIAEAHYLTAGDLP